MTDKLHGRLSTDGWGKGHAQTAVINDSDLAHDLGMKLSPCMCNHSDSKSQTMLLFMVCVAWHKSAHCAACSGSPHLPSCNVFDDDKLGSMEMLSPKQCAVINTDWRVLSVIQKYTKIAMVRRSDTTIYWDQMSNGCCEWASQLTSVILAICPHCISLRPH